MSNQVKLINLRFFQLFPKFLFVHKNCKTRIMNEAFLTHFHADCKKKKTFQTIDTFEK